MFLDDERIMINMCKKELWRSVKGYEGLYEVSNMGRVKSLNYARSGQERIMKVRVNRTGYCFIDLYNQNGKTTFKVHRLVAEAFLEDFSKDLEVNHINSNKADNSVANLEMVTHSENIKHAYRTGNHKNAVPVRLTKGDEVLEFINIAEAAAYIGAKGTNISKCLNGKHKTVKGYKAERIERE